MTSRRSVPPRSKLLLLILSAVLCTGGLTACGRRRAPAQRFFLNGGERIVFLGDSITQSGLYVSYLDAFLRTRFPDRRFQLLNHGLNGETVSGNRDAGTTTGRPNALRRFTRDVSLWRPQVVVAGYGMNDGCYRPLDESRFARFKNGVHALLERTRNEAHASLVLLTPPPFDPYRRHASDPNARDFSYWFPAIDYDETLKAYSRWLTSFNPENVVVADVHSALNDHLKRRREGDVGFFLSDDAVHPNATGHWLIAQTLLLAWQAPALVAETRIDARTLQADSTAVRDLKRVGDDLLATWRTGLPMPYDPAWDIRSLELERVSERLNRYRLTISGLSAPRYLLRARLADSDSDSAAVAESVTGPYTREELAAGLDLTTLPSFPTVVLANQVLELTLQVRADADALWRARRDLPVVEPDPRDERLRRLCQPHDLQLRLSPL